MKEQVLSIPQMQELIDIGVDVSKASCCWCKVQAPNREGFNWVILPEHLNKCDTEHTPTFTLQDILDMLPPTLEFQNVYGNTHFEYIQFWGDGWNQMAVVDPLHPSSPRITTSNISPLRAAFDMLKWCKQNNYI